MVTQCEFSAMGYNRSFSSFHNFMEGPQPMVGYYASIKLWSGMGDSLGGGVVYIQVSDRLDPLRTPWYDIHLGVS